MVQHARGIAGLDSPAFSVRFKSTFLVLFVRCAVNHLLTTFCDHVSLLFHADKNVCIFSVERSIFEVNAYKFIATIESRDFGSEAYNSYTCLHHLKTFNFQHI